MKFENKKEEFIYYVEKSKFYLKRKDPINYKICLDKAHSILEELEKENNDSK